MFQFVTDPLKRGFFIGTIKEYFTQAHMRKIEREMQQAICNLSNGQTWRKSNTEVAKNSEGDTSVYLHGNRIAFVSQFGDITLSSCGWDTPTTKSRLNAILDTFLHGFHVWQRNFTWYIGNTGNCGPTAPDADVFFDGYKITR